MTNLPVPNLRTAVAGEFETAAFMNAFRDAIRFLTNKPYAFIYQATAQTTTNAVNAVTLFDATLWDNYSGHNNVTNNTRYTAQVAGTYGVLCHASWAPNATGSRLVSPQVNTVGITSGSQIPATQVTNWTAHETYSQVFLNVGDYVEMVVDQHSGGNLALNAGTAPYQTYMEVEWLRN